MPRTNAPLGARFTTPIIKDGLLYGYNNGFFCAHAQNSATLWTDTAKGGQSAAIVDAGSQLIALTLKGELTVFRPSQTEYLEVARIGVASTETWTHPVVAGNRIFIRDAETASLWTIE